MTSTLTTRLRAPLVVALSGVVLAAALVLRDPHTTGSWGVCPFLLLTGVPCPACGGMRAANDLLHGRIAEAASSNLYAVGTAGVAAVAFTAWTLAAATGRELPVRRHATGLLVAWFVGLVLFGVVRLLPGMSALRP